VKAHAFGFCLILLPAVLALGQNWTIEQIDSTAASQSPVELVKAADGKLWAGYQRASGVVRVACLGDSGWSLTDVCTASVGGNFFRRPFMAAGPHGELCLSCYSPDSGWLYRLVQDTWQHEPDPFIDTCFPGALAYDTAGHLYTAYSRGGAEFWVGHETDSGWTAGFVVQMPAFGGFRIDIGYLTTAVDGSPWFFGYGFWNYGSHMDDGIALMHLNGDTWTTVWKMYGGGGCPVPVGLTPHGDGVGILTDDDGSILCDSEPIAPVSGITVAALAYSTEDVPLVAWVPLDFSACPTFAFKTNRWHTESIPGPAGIGGLDIDVDAAGQVVIVYSTQDSGLWCARGTDVVGAKESPGPEASSRKLQATVIRSLPQGAVAFDAMGRRVVNPRSGVFFVCPEPSADGRRPSAVTKVVIQR
jgi:hypothetical protein